MASAAPPPARPGAARRPSVWARLRGRGGVGLGLAALVCGPPAGRSDEFVDVLGSPVWARKGALACGSADAAVSGGGFFSDCVRLPVATRVVLVVSPEVMTQVYKMRIVGAGNTPKFAWFSRESLTNNPTPDQLVPDP